MIKFILALIIVVSSILPVNAQKINAKEKMIIEGIINDYIQRIKTKDEFSFIFEFDSWAGALIKNEIDVYIYVRPPVSIIDKKYPIVKKEIEKQFEKLKEEIVSGITKTILEWPEFSEYKNSKINVILRIEEKRSKRQLEAYLKSIKNKN
jgi:hypothetical protein